MSYNIRERKRIRRGRRRRRRRREGERIYNINGNMDSFISWSN